MSSAHVVLPLFCPACGGSMKILAFLTYPPVLSAILLHVDRPHRPLQRDFLLDQTPSFDLSDPELVPDFKCDPSLPAPFDD